MNCIKTLKGLDPDILLWLSVQIGDKIDFQKCEKMTIFFERTLTIKAIFQKGRIGELHKDAEGA